MKNIVTEEMMTDLRKNANQDITELLKKKIFWETFSFDRMIKIRYILCMIEK